MKYSKEEVLSRCKEICKNTMMETLDIEFIDVGDDVLVAKIASLGAISSIDLKIFSFKSTFSVAASTTKLSYCTPSFIDVNVVIENLFVK